MSSLHSPLWHRVATLRPALVPQVQVRRQQVRGQTWWLLADPLTGRSCRLDRASYELAARLDGRSTMQQLWDALRDRRDDAPTQDETLDLLGQLREQGLLQAVGQPGDTAQDAAHRLADARHRVVGREGRHPLAWRIALAKPDAWLRRLQPWARPLFSPAAAVLLALAIAWLALTAWLQAGELWAYAARWATTPGFAAIALLTYLPVKLAHELAHGLAVRQLGGPQGGLVREAGVTLMLGFPMPYVDASAAASWPDRGRRMLVSAAGILLELAVAAAGLALWRVLEDGWARQAAFAAFMLGAVSTLVFNANPLQRLDGYFVLTDALQLPNLAPRSRAWWHDLLRRRLLGLDDAPVMATAPGERPWLAAYAPLAWLWSLVIVAAAVGWVATWSATLAGTVALLLGLPMALRPPWRLLQSLRREARARGESTPRLALALGGVLALLMLVLAVPMPHATLAQGVVWPPEHAQLRADTEGFIAEMHLADGQPVHAGELVLTLDNPALVAEHVQQQARVRALRTRFLDAAATDAEQGANLRADWQAAQAELDRLDARVAALQVRAASDGQLALPEAADLSGRWVARGQALGQVLTGDAPVLRVAVPDDQAGEVAVLSRREASVRLADTPDAWRTPSLTARIVREGGGAVRELPSAALSQAHGGGLLTDPDDPEHRRSLQPVVWVDLQLAAHAGPPHIGARGWARFEHGWSPWGWQLARASLRAWQRRAHPDR